MDNITISFTSRQNRPTIRGRLVNLKMHSHQHISRRFNTLISHSQRMLRYLRVRFNRRHARTRLRRRSDIETYHHITSSRMSVRSGYWPVDVLGERQRGQQHASAIPGRAGHETLSGRVCRAHYQRDLAVRVGSSEKLFTSLGCFVS